MVNIDFIGALDQMLEMMAEILLQKEVEWMAKKPGFIQLLEFLLVETLRRGMNFHLNDSASCQFTDFSRLMALCQLSLGNLLYAKLQTGQLTFVRKLPIQGFQFHCSI